MMRWLGVVVVSAGLSLGACGSSEKKKQDDTPAFVAAPDKDALVGVWSDGNNTISFDAGGAYRWEESRTCGAPPCPSTSKSGKWELRNGAIYLNNAEGGDERLEFSFSNQQKSLSVSSKKQGSSWSLNKR